MINMQEKSNIDEEALKLISHSDILLDHSIEMCGKCYYNYISAQVARDMLSSGDIRHDALKRWDEKVQEIWKNSKYYILWIKESQLGRDPKKEFEKRGWIV